MFYGEIAGVSDGWGVGMSARTDMSIWSSLFLERQGEGAVRRVRGGRVRRKVRKRLKSREMAHPRSEMRERREREEER